MDRWNWPRLGAILVATVVGLCAGYATFAADDPPRILVVVGGVLGVVGVAGSVAIALFAYTIIADDVRPALRFRKPAVPMSLSHDEAALIGRRSFRQHPVRFWAGLTLNNRFFMGFMLFDQPKRFTLHDPAIAAGTRSAETRSKAPSEGCQSGPKGIAQTPTSKG